MALENTKQSNMTYVNVLSDGSMRVKVEETTPGAVKRDYETSDGKTGTKYELVYTQLSGLIKGIQFYEGDFGNMLQITIEDGDETFMLSLNTASPFGEDMMKKIPNIDMSKPVKLTPFSFDDDSGKKRRGLTVTQEGVKVSNFFFDPTKEGDERIVNGYPKPDFSAKKKGPTKDDWKIYFTGCRVFLTEYIEEKHLLNPEGDVLAEEAENRKKLDKVYENEGDIEVGF